MNEEIQVLGIKIDNFTAKDAVKRVVSCMNSEPVSVVEMITMHTLGQFQQNEMSGELFENIDFALASDKGILEAAGVTDECRLKEVEELLFVKLILRFLRKNAAKVFLLAKDQSDMQKLEQYMHDDYSNLQVVGKATMEENGNSDDNLLNLVNGAEAECIISVLPSPLEEELIYRIKSLVNAGIWLGLKGLLDELKKEKTGFQKIKEFILRQLLKKEMAKKGENA